ncbi:MAG: DUF4424 family protein [Paracoccaceae bacterium]
MRLPPPRLLPRSLPLALATLIALPPPGYANDGFGGLSATGLTFGQTGAVAMETEDLYIGLDRVVVDYSFRNLTDHDVTGEVIFPVPPVHVWSGWDSAMNLPEDAPGKDLVDFSVTVDGVPVAVALDRIAVLEPPWQEGRPLSAQYDTPGEDVTAQVLALGLPLVVDPQAILPRLLAMTPEEKAKAQAAGLADFYPADPANGIPEEAYASYSIVLRYHWTQTFPAGAVVKVHHEYDSRPPGGLFYWSDPPEDYQQYIKDMYCIDSGTSKAIVKALHRPSGGEFGDYGTAYNIAYVLRTANSWAGPIGRFRLTLDKGDARNVISLCAEGVKKTGPTTFVVEKTDYTPERDLEVLVVLPLEE